MTTTVQIRKKGQVTIPAAIRDQLGIKDNEVVTLTLLDKGILIVPQKLKTTELLKETAKLAKKRGISLEEMLADLDEIRHQS